MYSMTESFNDYLNYTNSIGIDNSQLFLEIVETIISQDFDRAFLLKLKELLKGNMKNLFQFLVYNYPSYFIKKFLIPYFRPDIYFQYLNLFFSIEFKIFLNVNYKNVHFVQLFVILFEIPNNMVDEEGRIQVLTFSLDYLL